MVFIVTDENHQWRINWQEMLVNFNKCQSGSFVMSMPILLKMKYEIDIYKTNPADAIKISLYQSPPRSIPECNTWTMKTQFITAVGWVYGNIRGLGFLRQGVLNIFQVRWSFI